jgi:hypothetical protein
LQIARSFFVLKNRFIPKTHHVSPKNTLFHRNHLRYYNKKLIFSTPIAYNFPKELSVEKSHSLCFANNTLTINGVVQVVEVDEKEAHFKLEKCSLVIKGVGINIAKLDKDQGVVVLEVKSLASVVYKQTPTLKGLFR